MKRILKNTDRERIIEAVKQSKSGEGWIYIKEVIEEWKAVEEARLRKYEVKGMTEADVSDYNRCVDRIEYLDKFSNVHEIIIDFNSSILTRMRDYVEERFSEAASFVKEVI